MLGKNVRYNVSQGTISMATSFLRSEAKNIDDKIFSLSDGYLNRENGYFLDGDYIKYKDGTLYLSALKDYFNT